MNKPTQYRVLGFLGGLLLAGILILLRITGVTKPYGAFDYAILVGAVVLTFASMPSLFRQSLKEAVPFKKSDFIGYAVILAFILAVVGFGYWAIN